MRPWNHPAEKKHNDQWPGEQMCQIILSPQNLPSWLQCRKKGIQQICRFGLVRRFASQRTNLFLFPCLFVQNVSVASAIHMPTQKLHMIPFLFVWNKNFSAHVVALSVNVFLQCLHLCPYCGVKPPTNYFLPNMFSQKYDKLFFSQTPEPKTQMPQPENCFQAANQFSQKGPG